MPCHIFDRYVCACVQLHQFACQFSHVCVLIQHSSMQCVYYSTHSHNVLLYDQCLPIYTGKCLICHKLSHKIPAYYPFGILTNLPCVVLSRI